MEFDTETGVQRVISHLENLLFHKADLSSPFPLWEHLPPSHISISDNIAHLVVPPLPLRVGELSEMVESNDRVTPRVKVKIRAILRALGSYQMPTIHEGGTFIDSEIERCADSQRVFMLVHLSPKESHIVGFVRIDGLTANDSGERLLIYQRQLDHSDTWRDECISEPWVGAGESLRLVLRSDVIRLGLLQYTRPS